MSRKADDSEAARMRAEERKRERQEAVREEHEKHRVKGEKHRKQKEQSRQETGEQGKWRSELILVSALIVLLVGLTYWGIGEIIGTINEGAIKNCDDNNVTRSLQRKSLKRGIEVTQRDIQETRNSDPALFPDIPPDTFNQLVKAKVNRLQADNADRRKDLLKTQKVNCQERFP